ncbi:hypothetical protein GHT06_018499 [Daphnia sinensis]|uniref:Uncharacterized protein n=1 Tax=Daphnia sinensis TaxID=1820382 RepID=A0AAD5L4B7_9CRUS|nr:hypothetical protein GHT06_018499 [Daphnia sinensis]
MKLLIARGPRLEGCMAACSVFDIIAGVPQDPETATEDFRLQVTRRPTLRQQITTALNKIDAIITSGGPRGGLAALLRHVEELVNQASSLQTELSALETEGESERQDNIHLGYIERFGQISEASKAYYASRGAEASVVGEQIFEDEEEDISASESANANRIRIR